MISNPIIPGSISDLVDRKELDAAIAKFRAIPESRRTEDDILGGASALLFRMDWLTPARRAELQETLTLLQSMDQRYTRVPAFCYLLGLTYYQLEEYKEAAVWYKRAPDTGFSPNKQEILATCRQALNTTAEKESFRSRVQRSWEAFAPIEAELRQKMNDADGNRKLEKKMIAQISKLLNIAFLDVPWYWNAGEFPLLQLDPEHVKIAALQQQYFVNCAPKPVKDHWYLSVGESAPTDEELEDLQEDDGYLSDMDVQIVRRDTDILELVLYHPSLDPKKVSDKAKEHVMEKLMFNLGEVVYLGVFTAVVFNGMPPKGRTIKLGQLLPTLEAMGLADRNDLKTTLYRRHKIDRTPMVLDAQSEHMWREDIFRINTIDPLLDMFYQRKLTQTYIAPCFAGTGAIPGFVVFPLKGQTDNPPERMDMLLKELDDAMDPEIALVLGNAEGLQFGYLDLLAWDLQPALDTVVSLLQKHNLPWACWHTFYYPDRTVQLF